MKLKNKIAYTLLGTSALTTVATLLPEDVSFANNVLIANKEKSSVVVMQARELSYTDDTKLDSVDNSKMLTLIKKKTLAKLESSDEYIELTAEDKQNAKDELEQTATLNDFVREVKELEAKNEKLKQERIEKEKAEAEAKAKKEAEIAKAKKEQEALAATETRQAVAAHEVLQQASQEVEQTPVDDDKATIIYNAAMAQVGRIQDCTMLVTNALAQAGINYHNWPIGYMSLGTIIPADQAKPGDLIYYANGGTGWAHIAVYAGNDQAIHGGWNTNQTVIATAYVGSGPVFIRVA